MHKRDSPCLEVLLRNQWLLLLFVQYTWQRKSLPWFWRFETEVGCRSCYWEQRSFELHWESESCRNRTRKRKTERSSVWAGPASPGAGSAENFSRWEKGNGYFQFPVPPSSHILICLLIGLWRLRVSSLLKAHTQLSLSDSSYTCLDFTVCTSYTFTSVIIQ